MTRRGRPGGTVVEEEDELEITPMIDVVFLLLIFFIFATKFPKQEGKLEASLPSRQQAPPSIKRPTIVVIEISNDGRLSISGKTYTPDTLAALLRQLSALDPEQPVIISGDPEARHQWVVDALNACARANITRISFTGL